MKTSAQYEPIDIDKFRRPPEVVMRLAHGQLSSNSLIFHAHPAAPPEKKLFKRNVWEIDQQDFGRAIYTVASADADAVAEFHECLKQVCVNIYRMSCQLLKTHSYPNRIPSAMAIVSRVDRPVVPPCA